MAYRTAMIVVVAGAFSCTVKRNASTTKADSRQGVIAGTVHGTAVDSNDVALLNVTPEQLFAFQAGTNVPIAGTGDSTAYGLLAGQTKYMETCSAAGVPIPPPWGDPAWKLLGELPPDKIFALDPNLRTEAYVVYSDLGTCAALPRKEQDGTIYALGMICQGQKSGRACFWDNVDVQTQQKIKNPNLIRPEKMSDGSNLKENCTRCHRGDNVFIVHVGTVLEQIKNRDPATEYSPIGKKDWKNPTGSSTFAAKCQTCHNLPQFSFDYCSTVLLPSITGKSGERPVMPPKGEDRKEYQQEFKEILQACYQLYLNPKTQKPAVYWPYPGWLTLGFDWENLQ